jgi:DNA-directed RNA polymerase subunit RPC12/RpoP
MMQTADVKVRCPSCGGADIRRSLPRGLIDALFTVFGQRPVRCRRCHHRFYRVLLENEAEDHASAGSPGRTATP